MEGDTGPENIDHHGELTRSCSDASALTAVNVKQVDNKAWTDEKHNLYLKNLEMSFVTQLNRSKELPIRCPDQCQRSICPSQHQFVDSDVDSDQFTVLRSGCWLKIKYQRGSPFSHKWACSFTPCNKSTTLVGSKSRDIHSLSSAGMHKLKRLSHTEKHEKETASHGLSKCSRKFSSSSDDSAFCTREGTGQNFQDDDSCNNAIIEYPMKRFRKALADSSTQDHVVPSQKSSGTDTN